MYLKSLASVLAVTAVFSAPAHALEVTNEDDQNYTIDVIVGLGDSQYESFTLDAGGTMTGICPEGCDLQLSTGLSQTFTGHEQVLIRDGQFVVVE